MSKLSAKKAHDAAALAKGLSFGENTEPNGVFDSGATSGVAAPADAKYMIQKGEKSNKIFVILNSQTMNATYKVRLAIAHRL